MLPFFISFERLSTTYFAEHMPTVLLGKVQGRCRPDDDGGGS